MIWLSWRQHRTEGFIALAVLAVAGIYLLITGVNMAHTFEQSGLGACLAHQATGSSSCSALQALFLNQYGPVIPFAAALLLIPALLGALVGAPLVAREYEQRTHLVAWMQSVTRSRWLTVQVAVVLGAGAVVGGILLGMLARWYVPFDQIFGHFNPVAFDFTGPVIVAGTVLALAIGIAAGAFTRRSVSAIFLTLGLLVAVHVAVEFNLRPNYVPQVIVTWPLAQGPTAPVTLGKEDWQLGNGWLDAQGNRTDSVPCASDTQTLQQCLRADGYRGYYLAYQPADRFWRFQWIETGIYLALSAVAIALTFWRVRRRSA